MNKKNMMRDFIKAIDDNKMMTKFIKNIFDYSEFYDYNYLFRMIDGDNEVIMDIYDNVSDNRFNRYIFSFLEHEYDFRVIEEGNVFVNYINVLNIGDNNNKLLKLAYLFKIDNGKMIEYASSFLDNEFVLLLSDIIK